MVKWSADPIGTATENEKKILFFKQNIQNVMKREVLES
jgi:hypothetical protein